MSGPYRGNNGFKEFGGGGTESGGDSGFREIGGGGSEAASKMARIFALSLSV